METKNETKKHFDALIERIELVGKRISNSTEQIYQKTRELKYYEMEVKPVEMVEPACVIDIINARIRDLEIVTDYLEQVESNLKKML